MAMGREKAGDFYFVLDLDRECSGADLRTAYRKLALKWHPDRCNSNESSKMVEATSNFQKIQEAYSALSDPNARLLYDVGIADDNDDIPQYGMSDFLDELETMMQETKPSNKNAYESFKELQDMFAKMLLDETKVSFSDNTARTSYSPPFSNNQGKDSTFRFNGPKDTTNIAFGKLEFGSSNTSFCLGPSDTQRSSVKGGNRGRRSRRK